MTDSLPSAYFDDIYAAKDDPWGFATSNYERAKYADTLAHLPRSRFGNALEVGCSIGVLTAQLSSHCDALLGVDVSDRALHQARIRCARLGNVRFQQLRIPDAEPTGDFDLILISEVAYYWSREDLGKAIVLMSAHQPAGGNLVLVHWTPPVPDYPLIGDQVHEAWMSSPGWRVLQDLRRDTYRLSVLERLPD